MHELTADQQRVAVSLVMERDHVVEMANQAAAEINRALGAAAAAFAAQAGLEGEWEFGQQGPGGAIGLELKGGDAIDNDVEGEPTT